MATLHEFVWGALSWNGSGHPELAPEDAVSVFWTPLKEIQAELEAGYSKARMLGTDSSSGTLLDKLHTSENHVVQKFKCMSGLQKYPCLIEGKEYPPASNDAIRAMLEEDMGRLMQLRQDFVTESAIRVGR